MSESSDRDALAGALKQTHRSVLFLLACAVVAILIGGFDGDEPPPDRTLATAGIGLGLAAIVLRRLGTSPVAATRTAVFFTLGSLVSAACLGLLGAYVAFQNAAPETGLLFTLAGVIFAVRPPTLPAPRNA